MRATSKRTKMKKLSARFEVRLNGKANSARFTKLAVSRIAGIKRSRRPRFESIEVIEHA